MNHPLEHLFIDHTKLSIGQELYCLVSGRVEVVEIGENFIEIKIIEDSGEKGERDRYTLDGKLHEKTANKVLLLSNPYLDMIVPRWMDVWETQSDIKIKRKVLKIFENGSCLAFIGKTEEEIEEHFYTTTGWHYCEYTSEIIPISTISLDDLIKEINTTK